MKYSIQNLIQNLIQSLIVLFFLSSPNMFAQQANEILGIAKEVKSKEYYKEQSFLWKQKTEVDAQNAYAWFNYYKAERAFLQLSFPEIWAANHTEIFSRLRPIIDQAKKNIGNSFEYYYLESMNTRDSGSIRYLEQAYSIDPNRTESYGDLFIHYVKTFQEKKATDIAKKILEQNIFSNANLKWNYNALQTADKDAVFICNGDMDTLPRWVLQYGKGIRKDVTVIAKSLLAYDDQYREKVFSQLGLQDLNKQATDFADYGVYTDNLTAYVLKNSKRPAYMNCGTSIGFFKDFGLEDNMYLVGLAFVYSDKDIDNLALTQKNVEEKYDLDHLLNNFQVHSEDEMVRKYMNVTYIPCLMKMKKHYEATNDLKKIKYYEGLISRITEDSGRAEEIKSWYK